MSPDASPSMKIAALRTVSYTLKTLGEVSVILDIHYGFQFIIFASDDYLRNFSVKICHGLHYQ